MNTLKEKVLFMESPAGGPHMQAQRAVLWDLRSNKITTVFDYYEPQQPMIRSLFIQPISFNYWLSSGDHVILTTIDHSKEKAIILDVVTKEVKVLKLPERLGEASILTVKDDILVLSCSSPDQPPVVLTGLVNVYDPRPTTFDQHGTALSVRNYDINYKIIDQGEGLKKVQTILIGSTGTLHESTPAIVIPHGKG